MAAYKNHIVRVQVKRVDLIPPSFEPLNVRFQGAPITVKMGAVASFGAGAGTNHQYLTDDAGTFVYHGKAVSGATTSSALWRIYRINTSVQPNHLIEKADGDNFTQIWNNRVGLSYS